MCRLEEIKALIMAEARSQMGPMSVRVSVPSFSGRPHVIGNPMGLNEFLMTQVCIAQERKHKLDQAFDAAALPKLSVDGLFNPLAEEAKQIIMQQEGVTEDQFFRAWIHSWLRDLEYFLTRVRNIRDLAETEHNSDYICDGNIITAGRVSVTVDAEGRAFIPQSIRVQTAYGTETRRMVPQNTNTGSLSSVG